MLDKIEVRSGGQLLFVLVPPGHIEYLRGGWLHRVDIAETLRTGRPVVSKTFVGAKDPLTNLDRYDTVVCSG